MKVLLTGSKGQLGSCFQDRLPAGWEIWATDSDILDITDLSAVRTAVENFKPNIIVNAAAYTAVDKAETEYELATLINKTGPENLAVAGKEVGARLVHVSTDYVFDGTASTPYIETDTTNPLGVYGLTKLDGEIAVAAVQPEAIIIRTAWVFSEYGNNFVKTMLRLAKERDTLSVVADQRGCPTYAGDIAQVIIDLIQKKASGGIYHFCGNKEVTWCQFAKEIFELSLLNKKITFKTDVIGIATDQYPTLAKRPAYSVLNCRKIQSLDIHLSDWKSALTKVIQVL